MKLLVCGGRDYEGYMFVRHHLDRLHAQTQITMLIHGGAGHKIVRHGVPGEVHAPRVIRSIQGADLLAEEWAIYNRVPVWGYPISDEEWKILGRRAGPLRNQRMLDERQPDLVIAFPGGRGTADTLRRARAAQLRIIDLSPPTDLLTPLENRHPL